MTRTPDEIKKGLECCMDHDGTCEDCPYVDRECRAFEQLAGDALALIQQLQAQNAELLKKVEQLQAERDAAVSDLLIGPTCETCKHKNKGFNDSPCDACVENTFDHNGLQWEWRGVQKEDEL